jgi:hypothetical protein
VVAGEDASRILFRDVAPGNYKLFAWEAAPGSESVPYTDPAFLAAYETQGIPVDVEAGLRRTDLIRVPLIRRW